MVNIINLVLKQIDVIGAEIMTQKLGRALLHGLAFIVISILILGLLITTFAYFEWFSIGILEKLIYAAFVAIFFIGTAIVAKHVAEKGWLIGLLMAAIVIVMSLLYYFIGIDSPLTFKFTIRCIITVVICVTGGMIGVNLPGGKK